ncbi:MAG: hypothetical protein ABI910_20170 [Gemmatimonadota bacterium]
MQPRPMESDDMMRATLGLVMALCLCPRSSSAQRSADSAPAWEGTWRGELTNFPARAGAPRVTVVREVGAWPQVDNSCSLWRTTYLEDGVVKGVKDYQLCRGAGADDFAIDEGGGLRLASRWIGEVLITPFKFDDLLLIASTRVQGNMMVEEIVTVRDKPATTGALPLRAQGVQRLELRRQR